MLEVKNLSVAYGQHRALENASLKIDRGEIVVILGANGAGKSTLLKAISGICEGQADGVITVQGRDILGLAANKIVEEGIALVPEGRGVFADLSVAENLKLGAHPARARDEEAANIERVLRLFPKLHERRNQIVRTMSGGEQQMVAIGRAMMSNPSLLTLDEPSLGLSPLLCKELFQALKTVRDAGIGVLLVEQNAKQSLAIADRGYLIENGHIIHEGKAADLRNDPAVQAAYLGGGSRNAAPSRASSQSAAPAPLPAPRNMTDETPAPIRSSGPSPDTIAAAALASLSPAPARDLAAGQLRPMPVQQAHPVHAVTSMPSLPPAVPVPAPAPAPRIRGAADTLLSGLSIQDLVAEASEKSRSSYGASIPVPPSRQALQPAPAQLSSPSIEPGKSQDRLKSVLQEIEDAAARARAWRPDPNSH